jgi:predicted transcriptional regulator
VPSVVSRLELGVGDPRLSIIERYAAGLGYAIQYHLIRSDQADRKPVVVVSDEAATKRLRAG